jgi:hypothetical protein
MKKQASRRGRFASDWESYQYYSRSGSEKFYAYRSQARLFLVSGAVSVIAGGIVAVVSSSQIARRLRRRRIMRFERVLSCLESAVLFVRSRWSFGGTREPEQRSGFRRHLFVIGDARIAIDMGLTTRQLEDI